MTAEDPATPAPRMPSAQRRDQLLDVAEELFAGRGYSAVTIEDIARAAGVTRPVPYRHFGTREGVYLACVERARREYEAVMIAALDPEAPPKEQLRSAGEAFYSVLEDSPGRWKLLFASSAVLPVEYNDTLTAQRFETIDLIRRVLTRIAGPDVPEARVAASAHAMSGVAERLGHWWLTEPSLTREEIVDHYTQILWSGLGPLAPDARTGDTRPA